MNINRRDAILAPLALGAIGAQFPLLAQAPRSNSTRIIGYLALGADPRTPEAERPMTVALRKLGWILGENLRIEHRYAELKHERLAGLAEELVRKRVDLIMTMGHPAAVAAARATRTIPVVILTLGYPVELGLIDSLARPGRNVTGTAINAGVDVSNKRLEFLREVAPDARRLSWLLSPDHMETVAGGQFDLIPLFESAAKGLNFDTRFHLISRMEDLDAALGEVTHWGAQALSGAFTQVMYLARQRIAEFALRHRLPSAFHSRANVEAGGLLSYEPPPAEYTRLAQRNADCVDRILRGARPGDLPVEQPRKYELVINLKTAKALGLTVPQSLLLRADEVFQ